MSDSFLLKIIVFDLLEKILNISLSKDSECGFCIVNPTINKEFNAMAIRSSLMVEIFEGEKRIEQGSGFVIGNRGLITCSHLATCTTSSSVFVIHHNDHLCHGKIKYVNHNSDLTYVELTCKEKFYPLMLKTSEIEAGTQICVVGAPHGLKDTVTHGKISHANRVLDSKPDDMNYLQLDITVDHGSSGSPIFDMSDQTVIGVVAFKFNVGYGFGIPAKFIKKLLEESSLLEGSGYDKVCRFPRYLGFCLKKVPYSLFVDMKLERQIPKDIFSGLWVSDLKIPSPASKAGIKAEDMVVKVNHHKVETVRDFIEEIGSGPVRLTIYTANGERKIVHLE